MQTIKDQFYNMLENNIIPCFEFELSNDEFITVDIDYRDAGIVFSFGTDELPTYFSGNVEQLSDNTFIYLFDEYFDSLDYYLQEVYQEVMEGFILANDMEVK